MSAVKLFLFWSIWRKRIPDADLERIQAEGKEALHPNQEPHRSLGIVYAWRTEA